MWINPSRRRLVLGAAGLAGLPGITLGQEEFPSRPIRIVVPVAPGFGTDTLARLVGEKLRAKSGQAVVIENRAGGASGSVGAEYVARSAPDGYTLLFGSPGALALNRLLYARLGYDSTEFVPISLVAISPNVLVTRPEAPFKTVGELMAHAKANPGKLNYASGGPGTTIHLAAELLKSLAALDIMHIPYKGSAAANNGVLQGQADFMFAELSSSLPLIKGGRLRALAVGTEARIAALPDVPTLSETLPGFQSTVWFGLVAPARTPPAVAARLSAWVAEIMKQPDVVARLQGMSTQPVGSTGPEMARFMQQESERWGGVIRSARITAE